MKTRNTMRSDRNSILTALLTTAAATAFFASAQATHAQLFGGEGQDPEQPITVPSGLDAGQPAEPQVAPSNARLTFEAVKHDFGTVSDVAPVTTEFKFTNTGSEMLIISKVDSACGCTVPELKIRDYLPGESGTISVTFDPRDRPGRHHKVVTVHSNDSSSPNHRLEIDVEVKPAVLVSPIGVLNLGRLVYGNAATGEVVLTSTRPKFDIKSIEINGPNVTGEVVKREHVARESDGVMEHRITVRFDLPADAPMGWIDRPVVFKTLISNEDGTGEVEHAVKHNVTAHVGGPIDVKPERLSFGTPSAGMEMKREARLYSRVPGRTFNILSTRVETQSPVELNVTHDIVDINGEQVPRISVTGVAPQDPGSFTGSIFVTTDMPEQSEIEIKFYGTTRVRKAVVTPQSGETADESPRFVVPAGNGGGGAATESGTSGGGSGGN